MAQYPEAHRRLRGYTCDTKRIAGFGLSSTDSQAKGSVHGHTNRFLSLPHAAMPRRLRVLPGDGSDRQVTHLL